MIMFVNKNNMKNNMLAFINLKAGFITELPHAREQPDYQSMVCGKRCMNIRSYSKFVNVCNPAIKFQIYDPVITPVRGIDFVIPGL